MTFIGLPQPVVHYRFGCDDNGRVRVVESGPKMETLVAHHRNPPLCHLSSNGMVSLSVLESNSTIQDLEQVFAEDKGFAVEVWMTPGPASTSKDVGVANSLPIFTLGRSMSESFLSEDDDCAGVQVALAQRGNQLEIRYVDHKGTHELCRVLILRQQELTPHALQQAVVTWQNGQTSIYLDGVSVVQGAPNDFDTTMSLWDLSYKLQLFGRAGMSQQQKFHGSLNMLSVYNQGFTNNEVSELYVQGEAVLKSAAQHRHSPMQIDAEQYPAVHLSRQGHASAMAIGDGFVFEAGDMASSEDWSLFVEVVSSPLFGTLYTSEIRREDSHMRPHDRLALDGFNTSVTLWYHPDSEDFFNAPAFSWNGTHLDPQREFFTFRLIVVPEISKADSKAQPLELATSETVEQEVVVIHMNHPPDMDIPKQLKVAKEQPAGVGTRPRAYLNSVQVLDIADFNIDRIRVDLWAENGTLMIQDNELHLADFARCRASERLALLGSSAVSWSCHGNGVSNRNMTFVALPDDVSQILSHVEYIGFYWNQTDEVVIRIYDGIDGPCLSQKEHRLVQYPDQSSKYHTIHNDECFEVVARIHVPAIQQDKAFTNSGGYLKALFDFGDFGWADGIFWGVFLLLVVACCCSIRTCIRCFGVRGPKIHIDDESHVESDIVV